MEELLGIMMRSSLTYTVIADGSGVNKNTIVRWGDKTRHPRIDTLAKVARFLGYRIVIVRDNSARNAPWKHRLQ
jgi:DNA-binding phage protein